MTDLLQVILDMRSGQVAQDCNNKFNDVLAAVLDTGCKGELMIKILVEPSKFGMGRAVLEIQATHECKVKKPENSIGKSLFFVTKDGSLTRDDPEQTAMFDLETEKKEVNGNGRS